MDTQNIQNQANTQGEGAEEQKICDIANKVDKRCPFEVKTRLNEEQEDKLAAFLRKVQSSIENDDEFDNSIKNKIQDWKEEIENKQ